VLARRFGLAQGFDVYDDDIPHDPVRQSAAQRRASDVNRAALRFLETTEPPFLLFVHYYDPHASYEPPPPFDRELAGRPYDGEIAAVDAALGELLEALAARGWLDATLVAVTSDHGESLGEHDETTHAYGVYDATQHVPWILAGPGLPRGRVVEGVNRLADVAPTLLARLGQAPLAGTDGVDLTPQIEGDRAAADGAPPARTAYVESLATRIDQGWSPLHGLRSAGHLYVRAPQPELYALAGDPDQRTNLLATPGPPSPALRAVLASHEAALEARLAAAAEAGTARLPLAPSTRRELESLGYALPAEPLPDSGLDPKEGRAALQRAHEAEQALAAGRREEAIRMLEELVAAQPASPALRARLGLAAASAGDLEAALRETREAASLVPRSADYRLQLGTIHAARGEIEDAIAVFGEALALEPDLVAGLLLRMAALAKAGRAQAAARDAARALELAPGRADVARHVADAWERAGERARAIEAYARVLELAPDSARDHMHLAIHLAAAGRLEESDAHLARAGAVRDDPRARRMLAAAYRSAGVPERAP
jgi:tetratricopeptide (TPR) repeat protein